MTTHTRFWVSAGYGDKGRLHLYQDCRFLRWAVVREATPQERKTMRLCIACERRRQLEQAG